MIPNTKIHVSSAQPPKHVSQATRFGTKPSKQTRVVEQQQHVQNTDTYSFVYTEIEIRVIRFSIFTPASVHITVISIEDG
jgi:hypothetical protein